MQFLYSRRHRRAPDGHRVLRADRRARERRGRAAALDEAQRRGGRAVHRRAPFRPAAAQRRQPPGDRDRPRGARRHRLRRLQQARHVWRPAAASRSRCSSRWARPCAWTRARASTSPVRRRDQRRAAVFALYQQEVTGELAGLGAGSRRAPVHDGAGPRRRRPSRGAGRRDRPPRPRLVAGPHRPAGAQHPARRVCWSCAIPSWWPTASRSRPRERSTRRCGPPRPTAGSTPPASSTGFSAPPWATCARIRPRRDRFAATARRAHRSARAGRGAAAQRASWTATPRRSWSTSARAWPPARAPSWTARRGAGDVPPGQDTLI